MNEISPFRYYFRRLKGLTTASEDTEYQQYLKLRQTKAKLLKLKAKFPAGDPGAARVLKQIETTNRSQGIRDVPNPVVKWQG